MDGTMIKKKEELGVDFRKAMALLWKKAWLIGLVSVLCAVVVYLGTRLFITPRYESTAMFYVNNSEGNRAEPSYSISSSDISAAKNLADSYIVILDTNATMEEIINFAGVNYSTQELREMITAEPVNSTEIFAVTVNSTDAKEAARIAEAISVILPARIAGIIDGTSAIVVDSPVVANKPSSPNSVQSAIVGFMFGFVIVVGVLLLREMFNVQIRTEEDIAQNCAYPLLTSIPDMLSVSANNGYRYDRKKSYTQNTAKEPGLIGGDVSFAVSESYKLLRAKLQFSFADENDCHVIGVSSAMSGEGKSVSAVNLAYTMAQLKKRVILVDCDMRRPTLAAKLKIEKYPGLSNLLTGQDKLEDVVQNSGTLMSDAPFHVITAGQNPPNPVELLGSAKMVAVLDILRKNYDYIILDLPPVGEVSDALVAAKETDGILLVVRQDTCSRPALADTVAQFEYVNARILGVMFNAVSESGKSGYYRRSYYGYYSKNSRSGQEGSSRRGKPRIGKRT